MAARKTDVTNTRAAKGVTVIGSNVTVEDGRIVVVDDLVVYGLVDADVVAGGNVNVAGGGRVVGRIQANSVSISGLVRGEVDTRDTFRLEETGELYGKATARRFAVAPGSTGEFQLKMLRDETMEAVASIDESRSRYESVLSSLSELTGRDYEPSEGYVGWFEKQKERTHPTDSREPDAQTRDSDDGVSNEDQPDSNPNDSEIVIDWPNRPAGPPTRRERFASESAVGRGAWSKSVRDEVGRKNSEHLRLSPEEIELVSDDPQSSIDVGSGKTTDEMLNSSELRDSVEELERAQEKDRNKPPDS